MTPILYMGEAQVAALPSQFCSHGSNLLQWTSLVA